MEPLLILLGIAFGAMWVIGVPYLLISHGGLKSRVNDLEKKIAAMRNEIANMDIEDEPKPTTVPPKPAETGPWINAKSPLKDVPQTPIAPADPPKPPIETTPPTQETFVMRRENVERVSAWLRENWALAVAAVSLALGAIFMVQYGAENGLLSPFWRVIGTLTIGAALIAGGEYLRRRYGDDVAQTATQYVPSTFAGAGIFALFAGVLAARVLYDLISAPITLMGLVGVSVIAVVLGWFYGPVLAAIGIIGATTAPFLVGGASESAWIFYYYFAALAVTGLAVDTVKRWAWTSALTLVATVGAATFLYLNLGQPEHFMVFFLIAFVGAIAIPLRAVWPTHTGARTVDMFIGTELPYEFPTRLAVGMTIAISIAGVVLTPAVSIVTVWIGLSTLFAVLLLCLIWARFAPALEDIAAAPAAALIIAVVVQPITFGALFEASIAEELTQIWTSIGLLVLGAVVASIVAYRRMMIASGELRVLVWTIAAAGFAPLIVFLIEFLWVPSIASQWAMIIMGVAAVMTALAAKTATAPQSENRQVQVAIFAASALIMIALAMFVMLTKSALPLAIGAVIVVSAALDRRYDLRILGYLAKIGVAVIGYRLLADPGYIWAVETATLPQVGLAYLGSIAACATAWVLFADRARLQARTTLESAVWTLGAVFVCVLLHRALGSDLNSHWGAGLFGSVWALSMMAQLYRIRVATGIVHKARTALASIFGLITLGAMFGQLTTANPLIAPHELVRGPMIFDSLAAAYLPLAIILAVGAWRIRPLPDMLRNGFIIVSAALTTFYVGLEIRRFWQGDRLSVPEIRDGELYTYTLVMLLAAVGLLFTAFFRRSDLLRKVAMGAVAVTIAKVFLIDMAGLAGLIRVASFMGLGLGLAGLAWLNRKMTAQWDQTSNQDE